MQVTLGGSVHALEPLVYAFSREQILLIAEPAVCLGALWVPYRRDSAVMKAALAAATHGDNSVHHVSVCKHVCMYGQKCLYVLWGVSIRAYAYVHTYIHTYIQYIEVYASIECILSLPMLRVYEAASVCDILPC